jgi:PAS domain S-box-containing protein
MHELLKRFNEDRKLKILLLEDSDIDSFLINQSLEDLEIPFEISRVEEKEEYIYALNNGSPDLILSDYNLPSLDGLEALEFKKQYCPNIPFIIVTSFLGEERAVDILKKGATNFVLKEKLSRLNSIIISSLRETESINQRIQAEIALRKSEAKYRQLIEQAADGIFVGDGSLYFLDVNTRACEMLGYTQEEMLKMGVKDVVPEGIASPVPGLQKMEAGKIHQYETLRKRKDGSAFPVEMSVTKTSDGYYQAIMRDISKRKQAQQALEVALDKLEFHMANSPLAVIEVDSNLIVTKWSGQAEKMIGWRKDEVLGKPAFELNLSHLEEREEARAVFQKNVAAGVSHYVYPSRCYTKGGKIMYCESYNSISYDEHGQLLSVLTLLNDTTVQKLEAEARREWRAQERKRVAREIHEGIGQMLVASKFKAASIDITGPDAGEGISQIEDLLEKAIEEVRRISLNMAPRSVEELGIENAIRDLCQQIQNTTGLQVSFSYTGQGNTAGNNVLSTIYRIVQEALNNVIKHSHASKAVVELIQNSEKVELKVEDNGLGFAVDNVDMNKTSGLRNMNERVNILGGSLQVISESERGTLLEISFKV